MMAPKHISGDKPARRRNGGKTAVPLVKPAQFETPIEPLNQRDEPTNELRATCLALVDDIRRELQTQLTRIAQMQHEIDALKRNSAA